MLTFLHSNRLQAFDNSGKPLDGGKLYFYELKTTTPKAVYADVDGTNFLSNPVILDSAGTAEVYMFGSYTVATYDKFDAQVGTFIDVKGSIDDVITGSGSGLFANNIIISVDNYDKVREIDSPYSLVWCQGRETQSDGGQGLFYFDMSNTDPDDDGITLTSTVGNYIRYDFDKIDPRWFGLTYDTIVDQSIYLKKAETASQRYQKDVVLDGIVYLNSDYISEIDSSWNFSGNARIVSTLSIKFYINSKVNYCGKNVFGKFVQPIFKEFVLDYIPFSIFEEDNDDGKMSKMLASTSALYTGVIDENIELTQNLYIPSNFYLTTNNSTSAGVIYFNTDSPVNISAKDIDVVSNFIRYKSVNTIGDVLIDKYLTPEFFSYSSTNKFPLVAALKNEKVLVKNNYDLENSLVLTNVYLKGENSISQTLDTTGKSQIFTISADTQIGNLYAENVYLKKIEDLIVQNYADVKDSVIISAGSGIIVGPGDYRNVLSDCTIQGDVNFYNCNFKTYHNYNSQFKNIENTTFENGPKVILNASKIAGCKFKDPYFYINFNNTITDTIIESETNIPKQVVYGVGGSLNWNGCVAVSGNIIGSDISNVKYYVNNCVGFLTESNGKIDNIERDVYTMGVSQIFTSSTAGFVACSGNTSGNYGSIPTNITSDGTYLTFSTSGNYNLYDETSATKILIRHCSASDVSFKLFKMFGGKLNIQTQNVGNSNFKVIFHRPDYKYNAYNFYTSGNNIRKVYSESLQISQDVKESVSIWNAISDINLQIYSLYYPATLTNRFGNYTKSLATSSTILDDNIALSLSGFIDSGCKLKIEIIPEIPQSNDTISTYFKEIPAYIDTKETVIGVDPWATPYVSSGSNFVSNKWISNMSVEKVGDKLNIKGNCPTIYINDRKDKFTYNIFYVGYSDPYANINGYYTYKNNTINSATLVSGFNIVLNSITSGVNVSGFFNTTYASTTYPYPSVYTSGVYKLPTTETYTNALGGGLEYEDVDRVLRVLPDKYEKGLQDNQFRKYIKINLNDD